MLKIKSIAADAVKEADGDWVDVVEWPGVRLRVRSVNTPIYRNARDERQRRLMKALGRLPYDAEWEIPLAKVVATFLLTGWEGLAGEDGNPLPYSPETAMEMMSDRSYRALVQQIILAATRVGQREEEFTVDAVKNSAVPSVMT